MTAEERTRMYAANCHCCLLAANMRDCDRCLFQQPVGVQVSAVYGELDLLELEARDAVDPQATEEGARF